MRSTGRASCASAWALRSSHFPAGASWYIRLRIRIHASRPVAAFRSSSPTWPADGLVVGRIGSRVSPRLTRAARRSRPGRRSMRARCAGWSCACSPQLCPRMTSTAAPRWCSSLKRNWNAGLAVPDTRPLTPVVLGPTGVGKTAVVVALADLAPITVISADARQLYRVLDVGTAKPDRATRARVPHRGLDLINAAGRYSAGRFARDPPEGIAEAVG